jgi:hypothetical protein
MGETYGAVAGVDFERYCSIMGTGAKSTYEQAMQGKMPEPGADPYAAVAAAEGLSLEQWRLVQLVWGSRCGIDPALSAAMGSSMATAMGQPAMPMGAMPQMAAPTVDPNDPALAPIEGVSLEGYVRLLRAMMVDGATTPDQQEAAAVGLGFPPGRWEAITTAWGNAVTAGPPASVRYMQLVSDILG